MGSGAPWPLEPLDFVHPYPMGQMPLFFGRQDQIRIDTLFSPDKSFKYLFISDTSLSVGMEESLSVLTDILPILTELEVPV